MDYKRIGNLIKEKRIEKGLTQKELSDMLYITDRAVPKWERGKSLPDISMLKKLCEILKLDVNEILEIQNKEKKSKNMTNILILILIIAFLLIILVIFFYGKQNSNKKTEYNCDKGLTLSSTYNNRNIFYNCLDNVFINGVELRAKISDNNFDLESFLSSLTDYSVLYDGGSILYRYSEYSILKCNTIDGNDDIIFGPVNMMYEDNFCKSAYDKFEKCIYTDIFRIVNIMDNYEPDDEHYVFITIDKFHDLNPINVKIEREFVSQLEKNNYYEFKFVYYIPNDFSINDDTDIFNNYELINISKVNKDSMLQHSSNSCKKVVN